jgi:Xaa-Pro dipeptidase
MSIPSLDAIQSSMREQRIDGWLIHDFRGSSPILPRLVPGKRWTTRRAALFIPAHGEPRLLAHAIDEAQFALAPVNVDRYLGWRDLHTWLGGTVAAAGASGRIAMDYAPGAALPAVSHADAGTVELVRALGAEVVSSANLIQTAIARWDEPARRNHARASEVVAGAKDGAFDLIREAHASGEPITECEVQSHILERFAAAGLETAEVPIVAVNAHSGDPHYFPAPEHDTPIKPGDWVLIDLWARVPGEENIFSDITWCAYAGREVPAEHQRVYDTVRRARDASLERAIDAWKQGEPMQGWQLDDAARDVITGAGYGAFIRHRTGHSLSPGPAVHGLGMNLDNLETHDTRRMIPGIGFTIEPGIYTPEFGVRLEINVYVDPNAGPVVTSCTQGDIVLLA